MTVRNPHSRGKRALNIALTVAVAFTSASVLASSAHANVPKLPLTEPYCAILVSKKVDPETKASQVLDLQCSSISMNDARMKIPAVAARLVANQSIAADSASLSVGPADLSRYSTPEERLLATPPADSGGARQTSSAALARMHRR